MTLNLYRKWKKPTYTIGQLFIDDSYFCDTLEDTDRNLNQFDPIELIKSKKIYGETAIPTGTYYVNITHSPKFNKDLPLINNVPGFEGIRIHSGNINKDTFGCILVGENKKKGQILNSRTTLKRLMDKIKNQKNLIINIQ